MLDNVDGLYVYDDVCDVEDVYGDVSYMFISTCYMSRNDIQLANLIIGLGHLLLAT